MLLKIGLQNNVDQKSIAWMLDYPGCVATGNEGSEAIINAPQALVAYQAWLDDHSNDSWLANLGDFDIRLAEVIDGAELVNFKPNWFQHDATPLTSIEVERGLLVLQWLRADLLDWVSPLPDQLLDQTIDGENWSIREVLRHVADTEFGYQEKLGGTGTNIKYLPDDIFERLRVTREITNQTLQQMTDMTEICESTGELWSARKILRLSAWHEKDHIQKILRLISLL